MKKRLNTLRPLARVPGFSGLPLGTGRLLRHALLWALFAGFQYFVFSQWQQGLLVTSGFVLTNSAAAMAGFYFFSAVVLPRWLLRGRWLLTLAGLVGIYYLWALLSFGFFAWLDYRSLISPDAHKYMHRVLDYGLWGGVFAWRAVSMGLSDFVVTVLPPILLRFIVFLLRSSNQSLRLERENLNLEVNFLKAQINPHFLFNTLNNLYLLVVKQDERAPVMVEHLTHLMHYTVHESDAPLVPLDRETGFLGAYLELERLRYGPKVRIDYRASGSWAAYRVTPLLFFPFVENAFKHGVDSSLEASWVEIELTAADGWLHLAVRNSFSPEAAPRAVGGVGIANVQKRLALHYAPADYALTITRHPETYTYAVTLRLRLQPAEAAAPVAATRLLPLPHP
ncbi:sensor histidine kinase [Hymenobacter psychrophilus]|uniref:Histidine kinase n=1 Tax=Hymenobacter psychrophilus TaxID=651662 RepID=A0A1H3CXH2_9BACT|nr:histidine kinase [Hymenobacter psychrophilus]SDX58588.1 Histidine kinase [Hymenobacter psychrophilus]